MGSDRLYQTKSAQIPPSPAPQSLQPLLQPRSFASPVVDEPTSRRLQLKLSIGQPNDPFEQEADRTAAAVVTQINQPGSRKASLQRQDGGQMKPEISVLQQQQDGMQTKSGESQTEGAVDLASEVEPIIQRQLGGGQPLPEDTQASMGNAFGADFGGVKVHTDEPADQLNRSLQARAFTTGNHLFFKKGEFNPGSRQGQELIAHELTHVVQQSAALPQRKLGSNLQPKALTPSSPPMGKLGNLRKKSVTPQVDSGVSLDATGVTRSLQPKSIAGAYPVVRMPGVQTKLSAHNALRLQRQVRTSPIQRIQKLGTTSVQRVAAAPPMQAPPKEKKSASEKFFRFNEIISMDSVPQEKIDEIQNPTARKAAQVANVGLKLGVGVVDGLATATLGPLYPRYWSKWIEDFRGIAHHVDPEKSRILYGEGKVGKAFRIMDGVAISLPRIATVFGIISLISSIIALGLAAGGVTGPGAAVPGLIAGIAGGIAGVLGIITGVLKLILFGYNRSRLNQFASGTTQRAMLKRKMTGDAISGVLSLVSGTLGLGLSVAGAVGSGLAVAGKDVVTSIGGALFKNVGEVAVQVADMAIGQGFATAGDAVGALGAAGTDLANPMPKAKTPSRPRSNAIVGRPPELDALIAPPTRPRSNAVVGRPPELDALTAPPTRPRSNAVVGRPPELEAPSSEAAPTADTTAAQQSIAMVTGVMQQEQQQSAQIQDTQSGVLTAIGETQGNAGDLVSPVEEATSKTTQISDLAQKGEQSTDQLTVPEDANAKAKLKKANQELDKAESEVGLPGMDSEEEEASSEAPEADLQRKSDPTIQRSAEPQLQRSKAGDHLKAGFNNFKNWLFRRVVNVRKRVKRLMTKVKNMVVEALLTLVGLKQPVQDMVQGLGEFKGQIPGGIKAEADSSAAAADLEKTVPQLANVR
jgi:hypothetical protein